MKLTEHFTREEMERSSTAIRLGIGNTCPPELVPNMLICATVLETIRAHYNKPIHVTSNYRSPAVNKAVGGSPTSAHSAALGIDFEVDGESNLAVCKWCAANIPDYDQVIYEFGEAGWIHLGLTNGTPRKQKLSAVKQGKKTVYTNGF
ncbi:MAG: hypothetical protein HGA20_14940 [Geobacteraceae bacterium]|nr:hypothetical protein [Geobacteraceae bacterium]